MIDYPENSHIPQLRKLWELAFGDTEDFLDIFFDRAFSKDRCRVFLEEKRVVSALYWFDCDCEGRKLAYIYAVATHPEYRGRGLCRMLMEDTHALLKARDYDGAVLVPQQESLRRMYGTMGYRDATTVSLVEATAGAPVALKEIDPETYGALRRQYLPTGGVAQEGENLRFLSGFANFYAGDGFVAAVGGGEGIELLGNPEKAPGIAAALGMPVIRFRTSGEELPFAMFLPLKEHVPMPKYFGLAFD